MYVSADGSSLISLTNLNFPTIHLFGTTRIRATSRFGLRGSSASVECLLIDHLLTANGKCYLG